MHALGRVDRARFGPSKGFEGQGPPLTLPISVRLSSGEGHFPGEGSGRPSLPGADFDPS